MAKAVGVGGVFLQFKGEDQELRDWYETHLQMDMSPYGTSFIEGDQLVLISFTKDNNSNSPAINFRVDNLREMMIYLEKNQCKITSPIKEYSYGLFAQFEDPFGNLVELWEPYVDEYKDMVKQEQEEYTKEKDGN